MVLMSHVLCFDQNRRRFGFDGQFVPPQCLGVVSQIEQNESMHVFDETR